MKNRKLDTLERNYRIVEDLENNAYEEMIRQRKAGNRGLAEMWQELYDEYYFKKRAIGKEIKMVKTGMMKE